MSRQKIGMMLFWLGVIFTVVWQALTWGQSPAQRMHTAEELSGTVHAIWGTLFTVRLIGGGGPTISLVGVLVYASNKGSWSWVLAIPVAAVGWLLYWQPPQHVPFLFGLGGTLILLSYFGILWAWSRTYQRYVGRARTGRIIQLLGFSMLVIEGNWLCMVFGNPKQLALAELPIPSDLVINLTLAGAMILLAVGYYVAELDDDIKSK